MNYWVGVELEVSDTGISIGTCLRFHIDLSEHLQIYKGEKFHLDKLWLAHIAKKDST